MSSSHGPVVAERGIGHRALELVVVEPVQLEHEEQKMRRRRGDALLHVAIEFRPRRIDRVAGVDQAGIGNEPPQKVVELLVADDRLRELLSGLRIAGQRGKLALEVLLERDAVAVGAIEIAFHGGIVDPRVQRAQVPFRQLAEPGAAGGHGFLGNALFLCGHGLTTEMKGLAYHSRVVARQWRRQRVAGMLISAPSDKCGELRCHVKQHFLTLGENRLELLLECVPYRRP